MSASYHRDNLARTSPDGSTPQGVMVRNLQGLQHSDLVREGARHSLQQL